MTEHRLRVVDRGAVMVSQRGSVGIAWIEGEIVAVRGVRCGETGGGALEIEYLEPGWHCPEHVVARAPPGEVLTLGFAQVVARAWLAVKMQLSLDCGPLGAAPRAAAR